MQIVRIWRLFSIISRDRYVHTSIASKFRLIRLPCGLRWLSSVTWRDEKSGRWRSNVLLGNGSGGRKSSVAPYITHRLIQRLPLSGACHHYGIRRHLRREIRHPMHHVMLPHGTFGQMRHHAIRLRGTCLPMRNYAMRLRGMCAPSSWSKTRSCCVSRMRRLRVRDSPNKHD